MRSCVSKVSSAALRACATTKLPTDCPAKLAALVITALSALETRATKRPPLATLGVLTSVGMTNNVCHSVPHYKQQPDYAARTVQPLADHERLLGPYLDYDPS